MSHPIICSLCGKSRPNGAIRVRRFLIFEFCTKCWKHSRELCDKFMLEVLP